MNSPLEGPREEAVKVKEIAILKLGEVLAKHGFADSTLRVRAWWICTLQYGQSRVSSRGRSWRLDRANQRNDRNVHEGESRQTHPGAGRHVSQNGCDYRKGGEGCETRLLPW